MSAPVRLRLSRAKGFDLQALSLATNGLPAVHVARPSRWGNPFVAATERHHAYVVDRFRREAEATMAESPTYYAPLRGKNLACWCRPDQPCHADVLLEFANRPRCEAA